MFKKTMYYIKKTSTIEQNGKKTTTTEETSTGKQPKEIQKLERMMDKFSKLMDEL